MLYSCSHDILGFLLDCGKQGDEYTIFICPVQSFSFYDCAAFLFFYVTIDVNVLIKRITYYVLRLQDDIAL